MPELTRYDFTGDGLEDALFQIALGRAVLAAAAAGVPVDTDWIAAWLAERARPGESQAYLAKVAVGKAGQRVT